MIKSSCCLQLTKYSYWGLVFFNHESIDYRQEDFIGSCSRSSSVVMAVRWQDDGTLLIASGGRSVCALPRSTANLMDGPVVAHPRDKKSWPHHGRHLRRSGRSVGFPFQYVYGAPVRPVHGRVPFLYLPSQRFPRLHVHRSPPFQKPSEHGHAELGGGALRRVARDPRAAVPRGSTHRRFAC
jgi:hypothetical protein